MQKKEMKILIAAKANNFSIVYKIFSKIDKSKAKGKSKAYIDVDAKNSEGATALHYAARHGNIEMMQELLSRGALIDACDKNGWRPLSYASANNKSDAVAKLIEWGSSVNMVNDENSPIHIAAALGHGNIVRILMEKGANIHNQNQRRQTPVDVACENNHYGVVNVLLSASSKQIEEFSESSFRSMANKSLSPSVLKTATLPASMSNSNIANMSINSSFEWNDKTHNQRELKRRTVGSQDQISGHERYDIETFKSHPNKKSESLNVIFIQEDDADKGRGHVTSSPRSNTLSHNNNTEQEIFVPYPSKFPTSEILKIKSPLLPVKSNHLKEQNILRKGVQPLNASQDTNVDSESNPELIKYRNNVNNFQRHRVKNKTARSSLPLQSLHSIIPTSPIQSSPVQLATLLVNGKPPAIKPKVKYLSESLRSTPQTFTDKLSSMQDTRNSERCSSLISADGADDQGVSCNKWIRSIGLLTIWDTLVKEGFENFLSLSLATDEELLILCNNQIDHLDNLKKNLESLNIPRTNQLVFSIDIQETLTQLGLEVYYANFVDQGYFKTNQLPLISEKLMNQLGIIKMGHRRLLIECLNSHVRKEVRTRGNIQKNGSVSNLTGEIHNLFSEYTFSRRDLGNKCNSLPRCNSQDVKPKSDPPPIPPRSCSIPNDSFTLNDVLIESMCQENISPKKKDYCASRNIAGNIENLDDIVNMLTNLGKELDDELNHIE